MAKRYRCVRAVCRVVLPPVVRKDYESQETLFTKEDKCLPNGAN